MNALTLMLATVLALAARSFYLELELAGWERVWRVASGPVTLDLRRNAGMARLANDSQDYPLPREFRALLLCVVGVPVWSRQSIVSLPQETDARIADVAAGEFDHLFAGPFRMNGAWRTPAKPPLVRH